MGEGADLPGAVLFACSRNAARSPMAAATLKHLAGRRVYVDSAGVRAGAPAPFAAAVMAEIGIDLSRHRPKSFGELTDMSFDLIVSLSPEAHHQALALAQGHAVELDYWPTPDPRLPGAAASRSSTPTAPLRDGLFRRIKQRFPLMGAAGV